MKNKMLKIVTFLVIVLMLVFTFSNVFASTDGETDLLDPTSIKASTTDTSTKVNGVMGDILGIVQVVAIGIAVIMLIVLAIKYISAAPSEKADIKKGMTTYVVGAALLFGASAILQIIKTFATTVLGS